MLETRQGTIGNVAVARVLESYVLGETAQSWLPAFDREAVRPHEHWLSPGYYDPETGRIPMPKQSFVLETEHHLIVIDTCAGNDKDRPGLPEMRKLSTGYLNRLAALGVRPEEVDFVMCTHLHVDPVGWNTRLQNGHWVPTFPNARYVMSKVEFEATRDSATARDARPASRNCFQDSVLPVVEAGKVLVIEGVYEMLEGFTLRPAPGHSPGHVRIELRSQNELGVFAGDLLHTPMQVPFWQWSSRVCWNPQQAAQARRELLEFCAAESALLIPGHFEAPYAARIRDNHGQFAVDFGW